MNEMSFDDKFWGHANSLNALQGTLRHLHAESLTWCDPASRVVINPKTITDLIFTVQQCIYHLDVQNRIIYKKMEKENGKENI